MLLRVLDATIITNARATKTPGIMLPASGGAYTCEGVAVRHPQTIRTSARIMSIENRPLLRIWAQRADQLGTHRRCERGCQVDETPKYDARYQDCHAHCS